MKKIQNWIDSNLDKITHLSISCNLYVIIYLLYTTLTNLSDVYCIVLSSITVLYLSTIKELYDKQYRYGFDMKDMLFNILGILIGILIVYTFLKID